jgi:hypothetical protein
LVRSNFSLAISSTPQICTSNDAVLHNPHTANRFDTGVPPGTAAPITWCATSKASPKNLARYFIK